MKLFINEFTKKDGTTGHSVKVGMMDRRGYGICVDESLTMQLCFEPIIRDVKTKDGKTFKSVSAMVRFVGHTPENIAHLVHPDYQSISVSLPNSPKVLNVIEGKDFPTTFKLAVVEQEIRGEKTIVYNVEQVEDYDRPESGQDVTPAKTAEPTPSEIPAPKSDIADEDLPF